LEKLACGRFSDLRCVSGRKRRDFCGLRFVPVARTATL